jgi:hypothetical protein
MLAQVPVFSHLPHRRTPLCHYRDISPSRGEIVGSKRIDPPIKNDGDGGEDTRP